MMPLDEARKTLADRLREVRRWQAVDVASSREVKQANAIETVLKALDLSTDMAAHGLGVPAAHIAVDLRQRLAAAGAGGVSRSASEPDRGDDRAS